MSRRRKSPWFVGALTLCGAVAVGELFFIYERWSAAREAETKLVQRQTDLATLASMMPPPTREVATAIEEDLARAEKALAEMRAELKGKGPAAERLRSTKVPAARTDAYFDLASYVERMRELARKHEVAVRPDALRFGFAAYANEGPEAERIEPVFRQRLIAQYLVESLLEARPRAILAVQREPTLSTAEREARDAAAAAAASAPSGEPGAESAAIELPEGPDYFAIDARLTARKPGFVETTPFRFVFTGQTAALRAFLNRLAAFELPVLVREVEVDVASTEESAAEIPGAEEAETAAAATAENAAASTVLTLDLPAKAPVAKTAPKAPVRRAGTDPIVAKTLSRFTVTVEFVELVSQPAPPAEGAAPSSS